MRTLTDSQRAAVDPGATKPLFVCEIAHSGTPELLSASGEVVYDGRIFAAGGCRVTAISDASSATIELPWSPARVNEVETGAWRNGICKIWAIPALPDDVEQVYGAADGILMLDGQIKSSGFSGDRISVNATHVSALARLSPRHTFEAVCNHIPAAGSTITWEGDVLTLESRR